MESSFVIRQKLRAYKHRFYTNLLIKGLLISVTVSLVLWLVAVSLEYFGHLSVGWRTSLFYSIVVGVLTVLGLLVVRPVLQMLGILGQKTDEESAREIGSAMREVDDRLLNFLNLQRSASGSSLAMAGVNQKARTLSQYDFTTVVNLRQNYRWLKWALVPFAVMLLLFFLRPEILREGGTRLVNHNEEFVPPAPFRFSIANDRLAVNENEDFTLTVEAAGPSVPSVAFIETNGARFRLKRQDNGQFSHTFKNVRADVGFRFRSGKVVSESFVLRVLPAPRLTDIEVAASFPAYTGLSNEVFRNRSTIQVPEGTRLEWNASTRNTAEIALLENGMERDFTTQSGTQIAWSSMALRDQQHLLRLSSEHHLQDSNLFYVKVVPDAFPAIEATEMADSNATTARYFGGEVSDDYGLRQLQFVVERQSKSGETSTLRKEVAIAPSLQQQSFNFYWNFDTMSLATGDVLEYYFEVHDNDGVNGSKSTRSQIWKYQVPDAMELSRQSEQVSQHTKSTSEKSLNEFEEIDEALKKLKSDILQKKQPEWQDRERMKELLEKQKNIMKEMRQRSEDQQKQSKYENKFKEYPQELLDKQNEIERMFEELFDEEFKEKWNELNEMLDKLNKSQMLDELEKMQLDNESLEKELDRTLELFKQLEFEKQLEDQIRQAEKLSEELDTLSEKTREKGKEEGELMEKQEQLQEQLDDLKEGMKELEKKNEELENPNSLPKTDEEQQKASEEMKDARENLDKNNRKKASEGQKNASESLEQMSEKLQAFQQQMAQTQEGENLEDLRQLLENVVSLSKEQERLMEAIKGTKLNDPQYTELAKGQKKLMDDARVVEDSLLALSKRVVALDKAINKELSGVQMNMERSLDYLTNQPPNQQERYKAMATERQQYVMTSLNNLALLLDEVMQQMQNNMMQKMKGSGACKKPGQGSNPSPSASDLRQMQESLNKQLQKLREALEKGENPNGQKPGQQPGMGEGGMNKALARMAAQQAAIREQLREIANSLNSEEGKAGSAGTKMKEIQSLMEKTEEELLYKKISQQTIERQQEILTRLLESEKAERERELDDKRESKTAYDDYDVPTDIWEKFLKQKESEMELYRTTPPDLKPFYRNKVNSYFSELSK